MVETFLNLFYWFTTFIATRNSQVGTRGEVVLIQVLVVVLGSSNHLAQLTLDELNRMLNDQHRATLHQLDCVLSHDQVNNIILFWHEFKGGEGLVSDHSGDATVSIAEVHARLNVLLHVLLAKDS